MNRLARAIVLRLLRKIHDGELTIVEGSKHLTFGDTSPLRPLRVTVVVRSPRFYRALLHGSVGLCKSYMDGLWECSDLVALTRLAALNVRALDDLRRVLAPVLIPAQRWVRWLTAQHDRALAPADRRALRPRQRALRAVPRPDDDVLLRDLPLAAGDAGGGLAREARARLREARPRTRRSCFGDRDRLGRVRRLCGRAPRLPRDDDDDLARTARLRDRARACRRPGGSGDGAARGLPRSTWHLRQARLDRDDRGRRLAELPDLLPPLLRAVAQRRRDAAAGDRDRRPRLPGREGLKELHQHVHLPGRMPALAGADLAPARRVSPTCVRFIWRTSPPTTRRRSRAGASASSPPPPASPTSATTSASAGCGICISPTARGDSASGGSRTCSCCSPSRAIALSPRRCVGASAQLAA